jgi:hypothetical protein
MENNITKNESGPYFSIDFWYKLVGSNEIVEIFNVSLIPIGIIGALLNILALVVMRSDVFNKPFYTYLKAYTICSVLICLLNSTQFTSGTRHLIKFTNSVESFEYYCYFYVLSLSWSTTCGSLFDITLSLERVLLLSKKLAWFKRINPKLLCFIFVIISILLIWSTGTLFRPIHIYVNLNETTKVKINLVTMVFSSKMILVFNRYSPYFIDVFPVILEMTFNVLSIYLIKKYSKKRTRIISPRRIAETNFNRSKISTQITYIGNCNRIAERTRRMEIKLTILVIFMSILSTMYTIYFLKFI